MNVLEMDFTSATKLKIKNTGSVILGFCLAPDATTQIAGLKVGAGMESTMLASALGDVANKFLNAYNSNIENGSYEVSLVLE